jgi:hypothetical protein
MRWNIGRIFTHEPDFFITVYKCVIIIPYFSTLAENLNVLQNFSNTSYEFNREINKK